jgi:hypothetical protein
MSPFLSSKDGMVGAIKCVGMVAITRNMAANNHHRTLHSHGYQQDLSLCTCACPKWK